MKRILLISAFLFSVISLKAQDDQVVPFTLADRDRILKVETQQKLLESKIEDLSQETSRRFDKLEDKFDSYFMWGFGMVIMGILGLTGFILYDRRTTVAPVQNKTEKIIKVLKETAENNEDLREALKRMSLW